MKALLTSLVCLIFVCLGGKVVAEEGKCNYKITVNAKVYIMPCKHSQCVNHINTETIFTIPDMPDSLSISTHGIGEILGELLGIKAHERYESITKVAKNTIIATKSCFCVSGAVADRINKTITSQGNHIISRLVIGNSGPPIDIEAKIDYFLSGGDNKSTPKTLPPQPLQKNPKKHGV